MSGCTLPALQAAGCRPDTPCMVCITRYFVPVPHSCGHARRSLPSSCAACNAAKFSPSTGHASLSGTTPANGFRGRNIRHDVLGGFTTHLTREGAMVIGKIRRLPNLGSSEARRTPALPLVECGWSRRDTDQSLARRPSTPRKCLHLIRNTVS